MSTTRAAVLLLLVGMTAACGGDAQNASPTARPPVTDSQSPTGSSAPTTTDPAPEETVPDSPPVPEPSSPEAPPPPPGQQEPVPAVLTQDDGGRSFAMALGTEVPLRLDGAWQWGEPVVAGSAVDLAPVNYFDDPGFVEWAVAAGASGTSTIEVAGEPYCGDTTVCPPVTVRITVTVP